MTPNFVLIAHKNPARCPVCGEQSREIWHFVPDGVKATRPVACNACAEK